MMIALGLSMMINILLVLIMLIRESEFEAEITGLRLMNRILRDELQERDK
jgi:hypothetical protein